ncbi:hypothetical protein WAI453_013658 [Rhynchosporium graminicola]
MEELWKALLSAQRTMIISFEILSRPIRNSDRTEDEVELWFLHFYPETRNAELGDEDVLSFPAGLVLERFGKFFRRLGVFHFWRPYTSSGDAGDRILAQRSEYASGLELQQITLV